MDFSEELRDLIKQNMLHITTNIKRRPRNYLNKQLQDAVCNYFLENYVAVFLKEDYQILSGRELRKKIEQGLPSQGKKYINLLNKFKSEILRVNKGDEYRYMLSSIVYEEERFPFESEEWCTLQKKKILALLLLVHWDQENILNFYDMWNAIYPSDPLIKYKLSKEEKEKKKCLERGRAISDSIQYNSQIINIKDYNTKIQISTSYPSTQTKITLFKKRTNSNDQKSCFVKDEESVNYLVNDDYYQVQALSLEENQEQWQIQNKKEEEEVQYNTSSMPIFTNNNKYQSKEEYISDLQPNDVNQHFLLHSDDQSNFRSPLFQKFVLSNSFNECKQSVKQEEIIIQKENQTPKFSASQGMSSDQASFLFNQEHLFQKEEYLTSEL